ELYEDIQERSPRRSPALIDRGQQQWPNHRAGALYARVRTPLAARGEIGAGVPGADAIQSADRRRTQAVHGRARVTARHEELDLGESEAIALALEVPGLEVVFWMTRRPGGGPPPGWE